MHMCAAMSAPTSRSAATRQTLQSLPTSRWGGGGGGSFSRRRRSGLYASWELGPELGAGAWRGYLMVMRCSGWGDVSLSVRGHKTGAAGTPALCPPHPRHFCCHTNGLRLVQDEVAHEESSANVRFLLIDCAPLKQTLATHCELWRAKLTGLLNATAAKELNALHTHFASRWAVRCRQQLEDGLAGASSGQGNQGRGMHCSDISAHCILLPQRSFSLRVSPIIVPNSLAALAPVPATLEELAAAVALHQQLSEEMPKTQARFQPLRWGEGTGEGQAAPQHAGRFLAVNRSRVPCSQPGWRVCPPVYVQRCLACSAPAATPQLPWYPLPPATPNCHAFCAPSPNTPTLLTARDKYRLLERCDVVIADEQLEQLELLEPTWAGHQQGLSEAGVRLARRKDSFRDRVNSMLEGERAPPSCPPEPASTHTAPLHFHIHTMQSTLPCCSPPYFLFPCLAPTSASCCMPIHPLTCPTTPTAAHCPAPHTCARAPRPCPPGFLREIVAMYEAFQMGAPYGHKGGRPAAERFITTTKQQVAAARSKVGWEGLCWGQGARTLLLAGCSRH